MRKVIVGILIAVIIGVGGFVGWRYFEKKMASRAQGIPFACLVSKKPLFYVEFFDLGGLWDKLKGSNFYSKLDENPLVRNIKSSGDWENFKESLKNIEKEIGIPLNEKNLKSVFGKDFAISLFASELPAQDTEEVKTVKKEKERPCGFPAGTELLPDFELFFRLDAKAQLGSLVAKLNAWFRNDTSYSTKDYNGHTIYQIQTKSPIYPILNAFTEKGLFILANSEKNLCASIDLLTEKNKKNFSEIIGSMPSRHISVFYVNNSLYQKWFDKLMSKSGLKLESPLQKKWRELTGDLTEEMICYATWNGGLELEGKTKIVDSGSLLGSIVCNKPEKLDIARLIPDDSLFCWWSNGIDLVKIKKLMGEVVSEDQKIKKAYDEFFNDLETGHGINVDKLLSSLGPKLGIVLVPPDKDSPITFPGILAYVETRDRNYLDNVITNLLKKPGHNNFRLPLAFGMNEIKKDKFTLHYVPTPISLAPGYFFVDSYLVAGMKLADFEAVMNLAAGKTEHSIETKTPFREIVGEKEINNFVFIDINGMLKTIEELVDRYSIIKAQWNNKDEENFKGFLELLRVVKNAGFVNTWEAPFFKFSGKIVIKDYLVIKKDKQQSNSS